MANYVINLVGDERCNFDVDVDDVFKHVIGQNKVVNKIKFFVKSHNMGVSIPNFIFTGSHGLGKTYIAEKLASSIGRRFISVNANMIDSIDSFFTDVLFLEVMGLKEVTVLIDEAQALKKNISNILLTMLNPSKNNCNAIKYKNLDINIDLNKLNFIFATTDAHMMEKPLINRCDIVNFESYNDDDVLNMLHFYLNGNVFCSDVNMRDVSFACRGRARDTFLLSKNIERYLVSNSIFNINNYHWEDIKLILGINPMGLTDVEFKLLNIIYENSPISCNSLSCIMMLNEYNIKNEVEVRLRELKLIENNTKGRVLTNYGIEIVDSLKGKWIV